MNLMLEMWVHLETVSHFLVPSLTKHYCESHQFLLFLCSTFTSFLIVWKTYYYNKTSILCTRSKRFENNYFKRKIGNKEVRNVLNAKWQLCTCWYDYVKVDIFESVMYVTATHVNTKNRQYLWRPVEVSVGWLETDNF